MKLDFFVGLVMLATMLGKQFGDYWVTIINRELVTMKHPASIGYGEHQFLVATACFTISGLTKNKRHGTTTNNSQKPAQSTTKDKQQQRNQEQQGQKPVLLDQQRQQQQPTATKTANNKHHQ